MASFVLLSFAILSNSVHAHYGCGADRIKNNKIHQNMNVKPIKSYSHNENNPRPIPDGRAQDPADYNTFDNLRLHFDTSQLEIDWASYDRKDYFVDDVIPAAQEWLQKAINVRPGL